LHPPPRRCPEGDWLPFTNQAALTDILFLLRFGASVGEAGMRNELRQDYAHGLPPAD